MAAASDLMRSWEDPRPEAQRSSGDAKDGPRTGLLLVVDESVDDGLLAAFNTAGIDISVVTDGGRALVETGRLDPSALLVSARLPVVDGVTVVRTVRASPDRAAIPILFAVGPDDREQAAAALEAGASACVSKPYRVQEVLAMVGAVGGLAPADAAGRSGARAARAPRRLADHGVLSVGPVTLDVDAHEVRVDGRAVHMPPREFRLLHLLLGQAGRVVTRETLLTEVWGSVDTDPNTLAVHVRRLRRRLGDSTSGISGAEAGVPEGVSTSVRATVPGATDVGSPMATAAECPHGPVPTAAPLIESIRGIGYRFRAPAPD